MMGDNHFVVNKVFSVLLSQLLPRKLGLWPKGDALGEVIELRYWPTGLSVGTPPLP